MTARKYDLTGKRFGRLVAEHPIRYAGPTQTTAAWWCKCDCGRGLAVRTADLVRHNTRSCGCYQRERAAEANAARPHAGGTWQAHHDAAILQACRFGDPLSGVAGRFGKPLAAVEARRDELIEIARANGNLPPPMATPERPKMVAIPLIGTINENDDRWFR